MERRGRRDEGEEVHGEKGEVERRRELVQREGERFLYNLHVRKMNVLTLICMQLPPFYHFTPHLTRITHLVQDMVLVTPI